MSATYTHSEKYVRHLQLLYDCGVTVLTACGVHWSELLDEPPTARMACLGTISQGASALMALQRIVWPREPIDRQSPDVSGQSTRMSWELTCRT